MRVRINVAFSSYLRAGQNSRGNVTYLTNRRDILRKYIIIHMLTGLAMFEKGIFVLTWQTRLLGDCNSVPYLCGNSQAKDPSDFMAPLLSAALYRERYYAKTKGFFFMKAHNVKPRAASTEKKDEGKKKVQHSSLSRTHAHCEGQIRREPPDSMLRFVVRFPEPLEWKAFISGEISLRRYRDNLHRLFSRRIGLSFLNSADFGASTDRRSKVAGCLHVAHPHASHGESVVSEHGRQGSAISKHPTIPKADLSFSTIKKKKILHPLRKRRSA